MARRPPITPAISTPLLLLLLELLRRASVPTTLAALRMEHPTYGWPVEMVVKATRRGYRIVEVPIHYRKRIGQAKVGGTLRGSALAGYHMIRTIVGYARAG